MQLIIYILVSYVALYAVIYLHEVGHGIFLWKYGCKKRFYHVTVKPYLFFSTALPIDVNKAKLLKDSQNLLVAYGGSIVNIICAGFALIIIVTIPISNLYILLFMWQFFTLHLAEAVTYMFIGNIYLVSDMASIYQIKPKWRIYNFGAGLILFCLYIIALLFAPNEIMNIILVFNFIVCVGMGLGRIIFSARAIEKSKKKINL